MFRCRTLPRRGSLRSADRRRGEGHHGRYDLSRFAAEGQGSVRAEPDCRWLPPYLAWPITSTTGRIPHLLPQRFLVEVARHLAQRSRDLRVTRRRGSLAQVLRTRAEIVHVIHVVVLHGLSRYVLPTRHGAQTRLCRCELPDLRDFGVMSPTRWRHRFANLACAFFIETINRV